MGPCPPCYIRVRATLSVCYIRVTPLYSKPTPGAQTGNIRFAAIIRGPGPGLNPTSYIWHSTPYTLHPIPYTLHPARYTLHPTPYTLHPTPYTLHPTRPFHHPQTETRNIKPWPAPPRPPKAETVNFRFLITLKPRVE